jgi:5-methylcytosine-specific restriction endonuclease McrA
VLIRDSCICRMCGASPAKDPAVTLHVDHIRPVSRGGATTLDNLQTLCAACNLGKADRF